MHNKKIFPVLVILILLVGAAAFVAGRMLNTNVGPLGFFGFGGQPGVMQIDLIPAKDIPQTEPLAVGLFTERVDNTIIVQTTSLKTGGQGIAVHKNNDGEVSASANMEYGPSVEIVITNETIIYRDMTEPAPGDKTTVQQVVAETTLNEIIPQSYISVWGRKSGDRIIAEIMLVNMPVSSESP